MPKKVFNNVLDHLLKFDRVTVEDIISVGLPTINRPTTTFDVSGMAGAIDVPNNAKVEAMELTINHNNGLGCELLSAPGVHVVDFRIARQVFDVKEMDVDAASVRYIMTVSHKSTTDGTIEAGNPIGSTETYSVLSYIKKIGDDVIDKINISSGDIVHNGVSFTDTVKNLLK